MRIVGGRFRGTALAAPKNRTIRPTSDRLREGLFNILSHGYDDPVEGARVLDLFAGTGALGLEALSRGARFVLGATGAPRTRFAAALRTMRKNQGRNERCGSKRSAQRRSSTNASCAASSAPAESPLVLSATR